MRRVEIQDRRWIGDRDGLAVHGQVTVPPRLGRRWDPRADRQVERVGHRADGQPRPSSVKSQGRGSGLRRVQPEARKLAGPTSRSAPAHRRIVEPDPERPEIAPPDIGAGSSATSAKSCCRRVETFAKPDPAQRAAVNSRPGCRRYGPLPCLATQVLEALRRRRMPAGLAVHGPARPSGWRVGRSAASRE